MVEVEAGQDSQQRSYVVSKVSTDGRLENVNNSLQSPRNWLEHCETLDGQDGAYTVMRCDFFRASKQWRLWGVAFHKQRLTASFQSRIHAAWQEGTTGSTCYDVPMKVVHQAVEDTEGAISALVEAVEESYSSDEVEDPVLPTRAFITLMLTILWVPTIGENINVRAHGYHSGQLEVASAINPAPITASVACGSDDLPNRYQNLPQAKLSSWCRRRTPLETLFKTPGVSEVLLTRASCFDDLELLEGLTSNVFVVYQDGSLRTPPCDSVLGGYARQLVLDSARECAGVFSQVYERPITLSEVHLWREIFTTSAIRLIVPVNVVITQDTTKGDEEVVTKTLWTQPDLNSQEPSWKQLYMKILDRVEIGREGEELRE